MKKLTQLEKSYLAALASGDKIQTRTSGDLKALLHLFKLGYIESVNDKWKISPSGQKYCRDGRNMFTSAKIARLHSNIAQNKYWVPKVGDLIYTDTRLYVDHGEDDVVGGLSEITRVYKEMSGGDPLCLFVDIAQHDQGGNWTQYLFPDQKELMEEFGLQVSYPDPDNRPSFNEGWR
jgi:hypothetical protein